MLHFVIGIAGTGKTTVLLQQVEAVAKGGGKSILLVPEQLSFETEKRLHRVLGPQLSLQVEVLSFTRLCNSIFRSLGGLADTPVTPAARYLMMSIAAGELRDSLTVYRKSLDDTSFLRTLVEACGEFKSAGVSPERLHAAAERHSGPLGDKLRDLSGIYGAYQALLEQGYSDGDDDLIRACALLEARSFFAGYHVFVDGFTTFMSAEFELLGHVVGQAESVWLALTCDGLRDDQQGMGVFSPVKKAAARLVQTAEEQGVAVAEATVCGDLMRYQDKAVAHIAACGFQPEAAAFPGSPGTALRLFAAPDRYAEMEYVAASITKLAREEGYRYREIAVIARDIGPYHRALAAVFGRYDIPYFDGASPEAANHPLISGLLHAVDAVRGSFGPDAMLLLAKSPLLGLDEEAAAELENYVYCWSIRGAAWTRDFTANPRGLAGALTVEDAERLAGINRVRALLAEPLLPLKEALAAGSGRRFAAGLYEYLVAVRASDHLTAWAERLPQEERVSFLGQSVQLWDAVMSVLDIFGGILGNVSMKRSRLCELLRLALETVEVSLPPQTLDQVLVGMADRIRPVELKAVFVVGAVEGEFPAQAESTGVFSDDERQRIIEAGVEIAAPSFQRLVLEKYFAYFALTQASHRLTVSYPKSDLTGQELLPSGIVSGLETRFPKLERHRPDRAYYLAGEKSALTLLAEEGGDLSAMGTVLRDHFENGDRAAVLARMDRARIKAPHRLSDQALAKGLFGERLRLSPTRVERYFRCPFQFFAADGLGLKQRRRVEFTPLESGSVIHHVLQVMVQRHGGKGLDELADEVLEGEIRGVISDYLVERVEDPDKLPTRFRYLFTRLTGMLARLLRRIGREFRRSAFRPVAVELPIAAREGVEPLRLVTADGVEVQVEGVVDRVDIMEKNGKRYVRVVDYKSGAKQFDLHDILYGINMQMLLYLFTIEENGRGELADCIPAGVLYMPVRERFVSADRDTNGDKVSAEREKQWRMSGLLLEDEEVLRGMEPDLAGVFIPAKMGKGGLDAKSSLAGKAELGRLSRKVRELVVQMAESLAGGGIGARPTNSPDHDACAYCDYRAVCGFEQGDPVREIAKLDREAVLKRLEEEEDRHV